MGVVDFGRLVAMQSAAVTATREAARYGSAVGTAVGSSPAEPQYLYCPGIRAAAQQVVGGILTLTNANTRIWYDDGTGTSAFSDAQACDASPARESASDIDSFDRIVVEVNVTYEPISPVRGLIGQINVVSVDRRMIVKQAP